MSVLRIENLSKAFDGVGVFSALGFAVGAGQLAFVLGPGGCGKSTLLRIVAGALGADEGEVFVDGVAVGAVPAHRRRVAMVGQHDGLWPHLDVRGNIAFALEQERRASRDGVRRAVHALLGGHGLDALGERKPSELAGGERQRVAFLRALAREPRVLLLDEPFALLSAGERRRHWQWVRRFCKKHSAVAVGVTQHVGDALACADRVGVLAAGRFLQTGTPLEVYRRPCSRFVGEFLSAANVLRGKVVHTGAGEFIAETALGEVRGALADGAAGLSAGVALDVLVRPESLHLDVFAPDENAFAGEVTGVEYEGASGSVFFKTAVGGVTLRVMEGNPRTNTGGGAGGAPLFAWVAPEDVTGVVPC
ncbi:MAG: ABC transporter ATP-binding protein [Puniceicoccales bacterium]|jgi:ABC-type Fe3+/spermidine/putrescine transport system ATPase subunit|nr:ABC transporter ATP-binding protein [Puniceicoccales bacterium]